ncbi:hypothetical protein EXE58_19070 [Nocardioides seonyuensis]|uniref:Uncharacterized protein n=1 Tax=Nocardioides seonyuensis TaxID=2518371 RepID=A0A4P7IIR5_9ACTN|nr:hypothetical protein [Nocardioides seonyuensis]QBX57319.1 hypothetical protein EXE58_19070 [Nocardioides seonyuensis]
MLLAHARTLCDARSALAVLSDGASCIEASSAYEQVLITLDVLHGDGCPAIDTYGLPDGPGELFNLAAHALEELKTHGVDELQVELLLALLDNATVLEIH